MKEYRAFVLDEGICWFSKEEISIYKRYGLLEEMKYYLFSSPPKLRGYPLRVCELLKKIENASFYPKLSGLIEAVSEIGGKLYLVGGSVRDLILYGDILREPDLLVDADVSIFLESLLKRGISLKEMTPFLTLKVIVEDELFDVAFCRKEFYERPGDLPKVSIASLMEDMYRRDFTINAMALGICGEEKGMLYDPFFGLEDLSKGLLRVIRPYSFIEDPTRIVRAVRLKMRFSLEFEDETLRLLRKAVEKGALRLISWVRLWREFEEFFKEENAIEGIFLMDNLGIFESIGLTLEEKEREVLMKLRQESLLPEEKERYMLYALFGMKGEDEA
ncbi:MAG: CCA tRNA nucleotidyltransferase, partial [Synergistetes bacterium]|nr:CCA tRNA nucleotidyltransferase [Synergistota bacterium]